MKRPSHPKFSSGPSKPPEDFCRICGDKLGCIGSPGCHRWIEYWEWHRFHEDQWHHNRMIFLTWIGILLLAIAITGSQYFYDDLVRQINSG